MDSDHNIYTIGRFKGTIDFNLGTEEYALEAYLDFNPYLLKLDDFGVLSSTKDVVQPISSNYSSLEVFPNPCLANDDLKIRLRNIKNNSTLKIYAGNGKLVEETLVNPNQYTYDFKLSSGVYFFHLISSGQNITSKVIVL